MIGTAELLVAAAARGSRCATVGRLALARAGSLDRMTVLREAVGESGAEADGDRLGRIAGLIWPESPTVREATALCRAYVPAVVARSGLLAGMVRRLAEDVQDPHAVAEIGDLARALSAVPIMEGLPPADADVVRAARLEETFRHRPAASPEIAGRAVEAARLAERVPTALGERLAAVVLGWLFTPQPSVAHADVLRPLLAGPPAEWFLARYEPRLRDLLAVTDPAKAATLLAAVATCGPDAQRQLDAACAEGLRRRGKRELDAVGRALERQTSVAPPPGTGTWSAWWHDWRAASLGGSLLGNLRAGLQRRHER